MNRIDSLNTPFEVIPKTCIVEILFEATLVYLILTIIFFTYSPFESVLDLSKLEFELFPTTELYNQIYQFVNR